MEVIMMTRRWLGAVTTCTLLSVLATPIAMAGSADAGNGQSCAREQLETSALDHSSHMADIVTAINMLTDSREKKARRFLISVLRSEIEVSRTELVLMEYWPERTSMHTKSANLEFDDTKTGAALNKLLQDKKHRFKDPADALPRDLRDRYGPEGIALFWNLFKAMQLIRAEPAHN